MSSVTAFFFRITTTVTEANLSQNHSTAHHTTAETGRTKETATNLGVCWQLISFPLEVRKALDQEGSWLFKLSLHF